jgi:hypothetical protein
MESFIAESGGKEHAEDEVSVDVETEADKVFEDAENVSGFQ